MSRLLSVLLFSITTLTLTGCQGFLGEDGKIYGQYGKASGTTFPTFVLGGFPSYVYPDTDYIIAPGSYYVKFTAYYNGYFYPGNSSGTGSLTNSSGYWYATYTVTANSGSFLKNGTDKHFRLYLNRNYGVQLSSGDVTLRSVPDVGEKAQETDLPLGPRTWTSPDGEYTVTITSSGIGSGEAP